MHELQKFNIRQKRKYMNYFKLSFLEIANEVNGDDLKCFPESALKLRSIFIQWNHL